MVVASNIQEVVDSVKANVLTIWGAVSDKRVTLTEVFVIIPAGTRIAMEAMKVVNLTNPEKHEAVMELLRLGWAQVKDWDIPWVPDSMERFLRSWAAPLVEGWIMSEADSLIREYYKLNPEAFGGRAA